MDVSTSPVSPWAPGHHRPPPGPGPGAWVARAGGPGSAPGPCGWAWVRRVGDGVRPNRSTGTSGGGFGGSYGVNANAPRRGGGREGPLRSFPLARSSGRPTTAASCRSAAANQQPAAAGRWQHGQRRTGHELPCPSPARGRCTQRVGRCSHQRTL